MDISRNGFQFCCHINCLFSMTEVLFCNLTCILCTFPVSKLSKETHLQQQKAVKFILKVKPLVAHPYAFVKRTTHELDIEFMKVALPNISCVTANSKRKRKLVGDVFPSNQPLQEPWESLFFLKKIRESFPNNSLQCIWNNGPSIPFFYTAREGHVHLRVNLRFNETHPQAQSSTSVRSFFYLRINVRLFNICSVVLNGWYGESRRQDIPDLVSGTKTIF